MSFRNDFPTSRGLQKVYTGAFEQDPEADYIVDLAKKLNFDMDQLDSDLVELDVTKAQALAASERGLVDGFLNGGVDTTPS